MNQLVLFDYSALDTTIRSSIEERAERIRQRNQIIAINVWENGRDFYEAQQELARHGYGCFVAWAESETGYSKNTVYNFIRVYERFDCTKFVQTDYAISALYLLAAPSTPDEAVQEAIERAQNGERISHTLAKDIISDYRPSPEVNNPLDGSELEPHLHNPRAPLVTNELGSYRLLAHDTKQCETCGNLWMADLDYCPYCHVKPEVRAFHAAQESNKPHVAHNSGNNEWYTPSKYIEAARAVMGGIDLDPASNDAANEVVKATAYHTIDDDGLLQRWTGRVWMNPPYAAGLVDRFAEKLVYHYESGDVTEAIVLVNNATETGWFRCLAAASRAICFPGSRVRFWSPNGESSAPLQGQAILYMGTDIEAFVSEFAPLGLLVEVL